MKVGILGLLVLYVLIFCSACQEQVASNLSGFSRSNQKTEIVENSVPTQTPEKEIYVEKVVEDIDLLEFDEFKIRQFVTTKTIDDELPEADISDAVLEKGGKKLIEFEGTYNPLGNQMQFGLFSLLNRKNKELIVYDNTLHLGKIWVVNFDNKAKQIFYSGDWGGFRESVYLDDLDNDGIYEIFMAQFYDMDFNPLASNEVPLISLIFKYDEKANKFLPANHKFQDKIRNEINESFNETENSGKTLSFNKVMTNFAKYMFAGMENEAWDYFDKNYSFGENYTSGVVLDNTNEIKKEIKDPLEEKRSVRKKIEKYFERDKIYQFIKKQNEKK